MTDRFIDTHFLVAASQGQANLGEHGSRISTVVASEFLNAQGEDPTRANYYVPYYGPTLLGVSASLHHRRDHPFSKHSTDTVLMDFNGRFPAMMHYGNLAMTELINRSAMPLFDEVIRHLPKERRKVLRRKFALLRDLQITCVPLSEHIVATAQELLASFVQKHCLKQSFRNSWNDLLILATAIEHRVPLHTEDDLLARHAADVLHAEAEAISGGLAIDFAASEPAGNKWKREGKGFVNRGWQVRFNQNRV